MSNKSPEKSDQSLEEALAKLSPEEARLFAQALELSLRKRRVMLIGNLLAILFLIMGFLWALYVFGSHQRGTFIGWVFLVPFGGAGACLVLFGRLARRLHPKETTPPSSSSEPSP